MHRAALTDFLTRTPDIIARPLLKAHLRRSYRVISQTQVQRSLVELLQRELMPILEVDADARAVFVVGDEDSSSNRSVRSVLRSLGQVISQISVARSWAEVKTTRVDLVVLVEDAVYSGSAVMQAISRLVKDGFRNGDAVLAVMCAYATTEAVQNIERVLTAAGQSAYRIGVGGKLPTLFEGLVPEEVLCMDTFIVTPTRHLSYMFDVLQLDDRHTLSLMAHKSKDAVMIPHTLLHTLPSPPEGAPLLHIRDRKRASQLLQILLKHPTLRNRVVDAQHARIAALLCDELESNSARLYAHMQCVGHCSLTSLLSNVSSSGSLNRNRASKGRSPRNQSRNPKSPGPKGRLSKSLKNPNARKGAPLEQIEIPDADREYARWLSEFE